MTGRISVLGDYARDPRALSCSVGGRPSQQRAAAGKPALVTIVTPAFNSAKTLQRTIDSVAAQTYPNIEYIVVDAGSSDGTVELLRQRESFIDLWLSEPDRGISDGFNKGIALAHGEFISLLNSDDWLEPEHVARAVACLEESGAAFVFGDLVVYDSAGAAKFTLAGDPEYGSRLRHMMPDVNHPSLMCRRDVYERYGLYDRELRIAMDYEWFLRGFTQGIRGRYLPGLTSHMSGSGVSSRNIRGALAEVREVSIRYGYRSQLAWARFTWRVLRLEARRFIERWISRKLAGRLRALVHPGYRPSDPKPSV